MSVSSIQSKNYVKFSWPVSFVAQCDFDHFSDQFKIHNLENVAFNIGFKVYGGPRSYCASLWVRKTNSEEAHAVINMSFGKIQSKIEIHNWKEICYAGALEIPNKSMRQKLYSKYGEKYDLYKTTITCEIFWKSNKENPPHSNLFDKMKNFYNSQDFSDVTLVVGEVKIPAHKVILSAHSPVFSRMLQSEMRESKENIINIKEVDAEIILEMLHYFYTGETKASHDSETALKMLEVADMYQTTELRDICKFTLVSKMSVDNVLYILDAADDHNATDLRNSAMSFIVSNSKKVFATSQFKEMFYKNKKPDLMFELMCDVSDKK
ncbi:speckle-type POZ protein B-like [Microplitis mediator]|uniref:speckle-type POZ protein B-like n=1 Tax=Microplitis mediator TaxID=375433 RepID=UPI00255561A3|nr:speckle-type POZ protein B-like [Microplitis mediator]